MTWEDDYRRGRELVKQRQYEAALKAFDKAARKNKKNASIFYLRSFVLETLNRPLESLGDAQKFFEESLKRVDLALECACVGEKEVAIRVDQWEHIMKAFKPRRPCFFLKLQAEIKTEIFALVIDGDTTKLLTLSLVCRAWRDNIKGSPRFWGNLVLTRGTTQEQVDAWLQRSGGTLTTLLITKGFSFSNHSDMLRRANPAIWSRLETLKFTSKKTFDVESLPRGAAGKLNLEELELHIDRLSTGTWQVLHKMDKSRLRHLVLCAASGEEMPMNLSFVSLTTLKLDVPFSAEDTLFFLEGTPMLECLVISSSSTRHPSTGQIDSVELTNLRHLELDHFWYTNEYLQNVRSPNLRTLNIIHAHDPLVMPQNLTQLEELCLSGCILPTHAFVSLLRAARSLKELEIPLCRFHGADENEVIGELVKPVPTDEGRPAASRVICCPQLQLANFSGLRHLKAGPVLRLVKAHLPGAASLKGVPGSPSSSEESPGKLLRILTLVLDDCPQFERSALPWLQSVVPELIHELTQEKQTDNSVQETKSAKGT